ncbi:alpha/beta fold hydrolase [Amycolatopsis jiangsuensis]|uniref:Pimeloyl-ACP methyl ester carboxylesterase n=1 Tax=Amycolatopsis jiangsuensis TaxID=1181879 RepID=A0A840J5L5_9PSEU|nr:alpha/beta hydrolase [Amycolatopsis jiangsuensis]MBB4688722.1 pimeloyl-ACP methyl ester carboxylesterase [Amycolatopsis jiangsuensis]
MNPVDEFPAGESHQVTGGRMVLHRAGAGAPAVVFLSGGGAYGLHYWNVHRLVAEFTTSVLYDRLGTGWSDPADLPRSGTQVTGDLRELLRAAGLAGPFVLAGHSLGGLYARLYAKRFPGEVAGLVLLDPTHESLPAYLPEAEARRFREDSPLEEYPPERLDELRALYRSVFARALAGWPAALRDGLLDRNLSREGFRRMLQESSGLAALFTEVRAAGPDPDVPVVFLSAMGTDAFAAELTPPGTAERNERKFRMYEDAAAALPRAENRRVDDAGHSGLAWVRPDAVVRAVRDVLAR